jgi:hypothetical protein
VKLLERNKLMIQEKFSPELKKFVEEIIEKLRLKIMEEI